MSTELIANSPTPGLVAQLAALAAPITSTTATGITTSNAAPTTLQGGQFRAILWDGTHGEIVLVTAGQTGTSWTVTRGASLASPDTCTSYTFASGSQVFHDLTAGGLSALITQATASGVTSFNARTGAVTPGNADYLAVASGGLTGATAATRFVGGTASGAPGSGTFAVGDFVIDQTGKVWVCTTAGSPGTWTQVGGGGGLPSGGSVGQYVTNTGSGTGDWEWPFENFIRISDHGATGNCKFGAQATTTASNTTVHLADATLSSGTDVGKEIVINAACSGTSGGSWATTISSVTDSTHCVVASAPTASVSNLSYAYGTDDTTAFNNSITAGQALNAIRWTLLLDDVAYMIAGSQITTNDYNTQIALPYITATTGRTTIEIRGKSTRPANNLSSSNSSWTNEPTSPVMFSAYTGQTGGGYNGSLGIQSMIGGPATAGPIGSSTFTQVTPVFKGITFLGPHWPGNTMTDMGCCQQAVFEDCLWSTNEADSQASPNWRTNAGCIMPLTANNDLCDLRGFNACFNHSLGFVLGEHTTADHLFVYQAQGAICYPTFQNQGAPIYIKHLETHNSVYHQCGWAPGNGNAFGINNNVVANVTVGVWHAEGAVSGTYSTSAHTNCGNSWFFEGDAMFSGGDTHWATSDIPRIRDLNVQQGAFSPPSLPGSGTGFGRVYRDRMFVFSGGTVSSITVGGTNVNTSGGVFVPSGYLLVVNYSAAPTISAYTIT